MKRRSFLRFLGVAPAAAVAGCQSKAMADPTAENEAARRAMVVRSTMNDIADRALTSAHTHTLTVCNNQCGHNHNLGPFCAFCGKEFRT